MVKNSKDVQDALDHFMGTLGNIPEPIRAMAEYAPDALVGYTHTRKYLMRRPPEGALDMRTKELVYVLLDVVTGNLSGAKNHLHAAMREGLTVPQLAEALVKKVRFPMLATIDGNQPRVRPVSPTRGTSWCARAPAPAASECAWAAP